MRAEPEGPPEPDDLLRPYSMHREVVARIVRHVELADVRMLHSNALIVQHPANVPPNWVQEASLGFDAHLHERAPDGVGFSAQVFFFADYRAAVGGSESLAATEDEWEPPDVGVSAGFELSYSFSKAIDATDEELEQFCAFNATFQAWPYWREHAQALTLRMGIQPLVVPVLRVPQLPSLPEAEIGSET